MKRLFIFFSVVFAAVVVITIPQYGMNWDEPARLLRGQAFLQFFLTGSPRYNLPDRTPPNLIRPKENVTRYDFLAEEGPNMAILPDMPRPQQEFLRMLETTGRRVSYYQHDIWSSYFMNYDPFEAGHLPLPELLGSVANRVLYQWLGVMADIDSYHVSYALLSAIGIFVVGMFVWEVTGSVVAGVFASIGLGIYPHFFASAHINMKDPEIAVMFAGCVWMFWRWVKTNHIADGIWFAVFFTLSLAIKWNTIFLPCILLPWVWTIRATPEFRRWCIPKKLLLYCIAVGIACIAFLLFIWPVAWHTPVRAFFDVVKFYFTLGVGDSSKLQPDGYILPFGINSFPLVMFLSQAPEYLLLFFVFGLWSRASKRNNLWLLLVLWFSVPVLRYSMPWAHAYGDWRQIMEIAPAMVVIAGIGFGSIMNNKSVRIKTIAILVAAILMCLTFVDLVHIHPNENAYFNHLVGGIAGAQKKNLIDYYLTGGNVYKYAALWLNSHAEPNARFAILNGLTFALSPLWLRPDIAISPNFFSAYEQKGEYMVLLPTPLDKPFFAYEYVRSFLTPVYVYAVDGVALFAIYKNDAAFLKQEYRDRVKVTNFKKEYVSTKQGDYISIDVGQEARIAAIEIEHLPRQCDADNNFSLLSEVVSFLPTRPSHTYGIMEKYTVSDTIVQFLFPGERARYIKVVPISTNSCFAKGTIQAIYRIP